jgi:hypothetical protein
MYAIGHLRRIPIPDLRAGTEIADDHPAFPRTQERHPRLDPARLFPPLAMPVDPDKSRWI